MKRACCLGVLAFVLMLFVGCGKEEEETLKICVSAPISGNVDSLVEGWQAIEGGCEVELIEISGDGSAEELKLTELRTEIMAGEGPDLFILECLSPEPEVTYSNLFRDVEKAMEDGMFLPLDEYLENAKYMDIRTWNQTVLNVGKTEKGQVVLPLYYRLPAYVFKSDDLSGQSIPDSWDELLAPDSPVRNDLWYNDFAYSFGKLADYQTGELLFSEEELKTYVEMFCSMLDEGDAQNEQQEFPEPIVGGYISPDFLGKGIGGALEEEQTYLSIPNREGSATAMVTMYAAVNNNTAQAVEAFSLIDFMFSDEVTSGRGFVKNDKHYGTRALAPVGNEGIAVSQENFEKKYCKNEKVKTAFETMNSRIGCVRFYSDLDWDLFDLCFEYQRTRGSEDTDQMIETAYKRMQMKLAE